MRLRAKLVPLAMLSLRLGAAPAALAQASDEPSTGADDGDAQELPDVALPGQDLPNGDLPDQDAPDGDLPDQDLPDQELPSGADQ